MKPFCLISGLVLLAGCVHFDSRSLVPEQSANRLEARSLTNATLKVFLDENRPASLLEWPHPVWNLDLLTLAAFYYQPDLEVARAEWGVAQAGIRTAGGRPNPTLSLVPGYDTTHSIPSPWMPAVSFDLPLETSGKRPKRIAAARHQSESARLAVATAAWKLRGDLRAALLDLDSCGRRVGLLQEQISIQQQILTALEQQSKAGAIAVSELAAPRIALHKLRLDLAATKCQMDEARSHLAGKIGVPLAALDGIRLGFADLNQSAPAVDLTTAAVRRVALQTRSDILGALADYAASQATLQLEIARQYPDVHVNPGYQFDGGDNKWTLGISFELPVLNQNQGPIAEAAARRLAAAARFDAVQARALSEIERGVAGLRLAQANRLTLDDLAAEQSRQTDAVAAQVKAGAAAAVDLLAARLEFSAMELMQLDGQVKYQQAAGALEDSVQRPLEGVFSWLTAQTGSDASVLPAQTKKINSK